MTKWKQNCINFCKCIKKKKTEISHGTTLEIYLRCLPFLLIIAEMFLHLDWSPPVIGPDLERHTSLKRWVKASQLTMHIRAKTKPCRAQIQDCFEAQIWERLKKHLVLKSTVASIIPDWWPRTWWTLEFHDHICRWEKPTERQTALHRSGLYGGVDFLNEKKKKLFHCALDLRLGLKFTFQHDNDTKHTAKATQEWLRDNSVNVLERPEPWLKPYRTSLEESENGCPPTVPTSNRTELERIWKEWQKIPVAPHYSKKIKGVGWIHI